jgi:hypothetical protein
MDLRTVNELIAGSVAGAAQVLGITYYTFMCYVYLNYFM